MPWLLELVRPFRSCLSPWTIVTNSREDTPMPSVEKKIGLAAWDADIKFTHPNAAAILDEHDPFSAFRKEFSLPTHRAIGATLIDSARENEPCTYFVGNSLGPLCQRSRELLNEEMNVWASIGVEGHFRHPLKRNWMTIASHATKLLAPVIGAQENEIACMGTLTANLHLLMTSFYKPTAQRYKILCEDRAFPSDQYAFASQAALHNLDPSTTVIRLAPRAGEYTLRHADILAAIAEHGPSLALVLFSGVQYYSGQCFQMGSITKAAHDVGAVCGWDLAHAVGNVPLSLHDWQVDFAVWCSYKYLNSGPGGIGGLFVHERWQGEQKPKLAGWWGHDEATRFQMPDTFNAIPGAQGFQQSNPSVLSIATLLGSLETFQRAGGVDALRRKSVQATAYFEALLKSSPYFLPPSQFQRATPSIKKSFTIITPETPDERGAQLSLLFAEDAMLEVFDGMVRRGVIGDERKPGIIRFAPIPLYCTFEDCRRTAKALDEVLQALQ